MFFWRDFCSMISHWFENKKLIWQFVRLSLLSGLIFFAALFLVLSIVVYIYSDNIKAAFVENVNRNLKTEIFVRDIRLNVFRAFPLVSLSLNEVLVKETANVSQRDTLMAADRIYLQISIWDLIRGQYRVRQLELSRARLSMKDFADKTNNYEFWQSNPEATGGDFHFELQKVILNQVEYSYQHEGLGQQIHLLMRKAEMRGDFTRESYLMKLKGELFLDALTLSNNALLNDKFVNFDLTFGVEHNRKFTVDKGWIKIASHEFAVDGFVELNEPDNFIDLRIGGKKLKLENFIRDLPPAYAHYFDGYRSRGEFYFDASIKGTFSDIVKPHIAADFGISGGDLLHRQAGLHLGQINLKAAFDNGTGRNLQTSSLFVQEFSALINDGVIKGNGRITDFTYPELDINLYANSAAGELVKLARSEKLVTASGHVYADVYFNGRIGRTDNFTARDFIASKVTGEIKTTALGFMLKDDPLVYSDIHADLQFNNNDIVINELRGKASESDFQMKGYFRNVLPFLFLENHRVLVDANLQSQNLNFNELLRPSVSGADTTYQLSLSERIDFRFRAEVGNLTFRKFQAQQVRGVLLLRDQVFYAQDVNFNSMNGRVRASGYINGKSPGSLIIGCEADVTQVDVQQLFFQMGNFAQEGIVSDNLRGRLTAKLQMRSQWTPDLSLDRNSLETTADVKIENGELINYAPMLALSRFLRVGDLNHVTFSNLENQIRIQGQKIIIPDMEIKSSALNIKLSGEHSFDNEIHYRLQVLLSDLLARRNRQSRNPQEQYGDIIDDGLGRTTLFLLVTGTIDNPVFRYDRQGVREKLRDDFQRERQNIRDVFRTEFGLRKPDDPDTPPSERQKEQKDIKKREQGKFVLEWEEF